MTTPLFDFLDWKRVSALQGSLPRLAPPLPPVELGVREEVRRLRAGLEARIADRICSGTELIHSIAKKRHSGVIPTMLASLDTLLGGGLPLGKMVEMAGRASSGRFSVVNAALAGATSIGEAAALIDVGGHFDPQFGAAVGIDLQRMLWIRPDTLKQGVAAAEMIGRARFHLVVVDAGVPPLHGRRVPDASWIRLARMAEAHGTALFISTPYALTGTASEVVLAAYGGRARWLGGGKSPRVLTGMEMNIRIEKHRQMQTGRGVSMFFRVAEAIANESVSSAQP